MATPSPAAAARSVRPLDGLGHWAAANPDGAAVRFTVAGRRLPVSWAQLRMASRRIAALLLADGVEAGDRVAIWSEDRPEWRIAELAALSLGASVVVVPLRPGEAALGLLRLSRPVAVVLEGAGRLGAVLDLGDELPQLRRVIAVGPNSGDRQRPPAGPVLEWVDALRRGEKEVEERGAALDARAAAVRPDDTALILLPPDGASAAAALCHTHANLGAAAAALAARLLLGADDDVLCALPPDHVSARVCSEYLSLVAGTSSSVAGASEARRRGGGSRGPTLLVAAPEVWSSLAGAAEGRLGRRLRARFAPWLPRRGGEAGFRRRLAAAARSAVTAALRSPLPPAAARAVLSVGRLEDPSTGAALARLGLRLHELVGPAEASGCVALDRRALDCVDVRVGDGGALLVRGDAVVRCRLDGAAVGLDAAGWLRTGLGADRLDRIPTG